MRPLQAEKNFKHSPEKSTRRRWIFLSLFITGLMLAEAGAICFADEIDNLVPAIIQVESSGNPHAFNHKSSCRGLMQISEIVLLEYNREADCEGTICYCEKTVYDIQDLYEPEINKEIGTWYLKRLRDHYLKEHYTLETLLASYSWGIGHVLKVNYEYKRFPKSVKRYIQKVKELKDKARAFRRATESLPKAGAPYPLCR